MDKNETLCGNFPTDLSPQQPYTYDCGGNCSARGMPVLSHDSAVRGWPAATELSDRTSPSGLPLTHRRPVWQLLLLKAVPPLWENLPQCWQLIKKRRMWQNPKQVKRYRKKTCPVGSHRFTGVKHMILQLYRPRVLKRWVISMLPSKVFMIWTFPCIMIHHFPLKMAFYQYTE